MFPPGFQTVCLILRPIAPADAGPIFDGCAQDPDVTRFLTWRPHTAIEHTRRYIALCQEATSARTYVLVDREGGRVLGAFALTCSSRGRTVAATATCWPGRPGVGGDDGGIGRGG